MSNEVELGVTVGLTVDLTVRKSVSVYVVTPPFRLVYTLGVAIAAYRVVCTKSVMFQISVHIPISYISPEGRRRRSSRSAELSISSGSEREKRREGVLRSHDRDLKGASKREVAKHELSVLCTRLIFDYWGAQGILTSTKLYAVPPLERDRATAGSPVLQSHISFCSLAG